MKLKNIIVTFLFCLLSLPTLDLSANEESLVDKRNKDDNKTTISCCQCCDDIIIICAFVTIVNLYNIIMGNDRRSR
ncbi:hypothetical protein JKY79_02190 [Candidatus Babeliales bacterium]|nr:hypothetical protein [Candidatus Babeliales bacterium]